MQIEVRDKDGNVITTLEIFDDVFRRMELEAAEQNISVEKHIINIITGYARKILDNEQD